MEKHELEILETPGKEGKVFKNINLKTRVDKRTGGVIPGIPAGKYIEVEKLHADGKPGPSGSGWQLMNINAKYSGEEVSFALMDNDYPNSDYKRFSDTGGAGDVVRISCSAQKYTKDGKELSRLVLDFSKVE